MLGLIDWGNRLTDVQGIIVGAESGPNARPFDPAWAEATQEACKAAGACFYMKQLAPSMGGADWGKWPKGLSHLKVRNLPWKLEAA
jgi:protein gp37